jgi:hypothetical protein
MSILLEFGRPTSPVSALVRIPGRNDPNYGKEDGDPYEHCAHFQEFVLDMFTAWSTNKIDSLPISKRYIPLETEDIRLLFDVNSFYRDIEGGTTIDWAPVGTNKGQWGEILPEDEEHHWWQITTFCPDVRFGDYRLYSIEINNKFKIEKSLYRLNRYSEFSIVMAKDEEINELKAMLRGPTF